MCFIIDALHLKYCVALELGSTDRSGRDVQHLRKRLVFNLRLPRPAFLDSSRYPLQRRLIVLTRSQYVSVLCPRTTVYRGTLDPSPVQIQKLPKRAWPSTGKMDTMVVPKEGVWGQI